MSEYMKNATTNERLQELLSCFVHDSQGIYRTSIPLSESDQKVEVMLRERVAAQEYISYLDAIARSHSIPVMDHEIDHFLGKMPNGALILDIGGCWGWHWRRLANTRPDVGVLIVDFVHANLGHAKNLLGPLVGTQVALLHADATALPFADSTTASFDGVWTVQVFQHIPDFARACCEAKRVLKLGGHFANYSLHTTPLNKIVYKLLGKTFHTQGMVKNHYHLTRANDTQRQTVADIFQAEVKERYTEYLFHPDLKISFTGRFGSIFGELDVRLSHVPWLGRWIARQRSFEVIKA
jgi:ubiquinone/menaquinone biosynthesis C-methylase UbiE